jgi:ATP-dependent Clp protease ATP-binding subunit ClpX
MANLIKCSFCGKSHLEVSQLIAGLPGIYICSNCVITCAQALGHEFLQSQMTDVSAKNSNDLDDSEKNSSLSLVEEGDPLSNFNMLSAERFIVVLNENVIGQDHAKKTLSVAVYNHYKSLLLDGAIVDNGTITKSEIPHELQDVEIDQVTFYELGPRVVGRLCGQKY